MSDYVSFDDFKKLGLMAARIISAQPVEGSEKLLKLEVSLGAQTRQLVAGIAKAYSTAELEGKIIIVASNLEPRAIMGLESQGMLLAVNGSDGPVLLTTEKQVPPGADVN